MRLNSQACFALAAKPGDPLIVDHRQVRRLD
jgi:hypothetical protein